MAKILEYSTVLSFERSPIIFIYDDNPAEALCLLFVFVFAYECIYTPAQAIIGEGCHSLMRHLFTRAKKNAGEQPGSSCPPASGPLSSSVPTDQVH